MLRGQANQNITGDQGTPGQRCHRGCLANHMQQTFLVEKKGGGQRPVVNLKGLTAL